MEAKFYVIVKNLLPYDPDNAKPNGYAGPFDNGEEAWQWIEAHQQNMEECQLDIISLVGKYYGK